ncbi:dTDP-4-dehydrorhamnose 3,5-epimerase family protein [Streptomyces sp. A30]|uniref:dTDP-4-dehydrorhamnose 3,5-epimerase family protein n=1 Tax=Streptomyces sp. A30 TaxID=2789273 RepID=UPI003980E62B
MRISETCIPGVFTSRPEQITDNRGAFYEGFRTDVLEVTAGRTFAPVQVAYSVSRRNTLRGIHSVTDPPGQAKWVTCVRGSIRDIAVDLRLGSPAFGQWTANILDAASGTSVYIPEGVGHGFVALTDDTCVCYLLSTTYVPGTQVDIDPFDPELAIDWGLDGPPVISSKDAAAQSLAAAREAGLLLSWNQKGDAP